MTISPVNPNRLIVAIGGNATHPEDIEAPRKSRNHRGNDCRSAIAINDVG